MNPSPEITITVDPSSVSSQEGDDSDYARWTPEHSPSFPRPLCVALPPQRPERQASLATSNHGSNKPPSTAPVKKPAPPKIPRRRVSAHKRVNKLTIAHPPQRPSTRLASSSPQRPTRQESAGRLLPRLPILDPLHRLPSTGDSTLTEDSLEDDYDESCSSDDESFLAEQLDGSLRIDCTGSATSDLAMEASARDLSPSRPMRQRTVLEESVPAAVAVSSGSETSSAEFLAKTSTTTNNTNTKIQPEWVKLWESQGEGNAGDFPNLWNFDDEASDAKASS